MKLEKISCLPISPPEMIKMGETVPLPEKKMPGLEKLIHFFKERETVPFYCNKVNGGLLDNL